MRPEYGENENEANSVKPRTRPTTKARNQLSLR